MQWFVDSMTECAVHADYNCSADNPLEDTLAGVNEVYKSGSFSRFGLSNWKVEDVVAAYEHCKKHGYVLPSAYQGPYNAVARGSETDLFPTLRKLGMAFYAYR